MWHGHLALSITALQYTEALNLEDNSLFLLGWLAGFVKWDFEGFRFHPCPHKEVGSWTSTKSSLDNNNCYLTFEVQKEQKPTRCPCYSLTTGPCRGIKRLLLSREILEDRSQYSRKRTMQSRRSLFIVTLQVYFLVLQDLSARNLDPNCYLHSSNCFSLT